MSFDDVSDHKMMLEDEVRTRAYEAAIRAVVRPGMSVLDFGCGSGILSFFASRAGAARVYAIDESPFIHVAEVLARKNGFANITFIRTDGGSFQLPEKVDVIVSEWMGRFVFRDAMLDALLRVRDAHLAPGGIMIPRVVRLWGAPASNAALDEELSFFDRKPYGIDFSAIRDWPFDETVQRRVDASTLLTAPVAMGTLDITTLAEVPTLVEGTGPALRSGVAHALVGWFDAELTSAVQLSTAPDAPPTHWNQLLFPLRRPLEVKAGDAVTLRVRPVLVPNRVPQWQWSVGTPRETLSGDDFAYRAFMKR